MVEHFAHVLVVQTLVLAVASVCVRLLQAATVRHLGAGAGYLAWLLVPVAMVAAALPHPAMQAMVVHVDVAAAVPDWVAAPVQAASARSAVLVPAAIAGWAAGVVMLTAWLVRRQRDFEALVAPPSTGRTACLPAGAGPAVLGLWRRRIVLPRDFDKSFDAEERRLMLAHEGVHLRRADNAWNLLATALLVAHWFNPVAWWAWRRLRADQELSCDAAVLRQESPDALAAYANALLKVQGVALAPPLATSWQSSHPLVERVRMLQLHRISSARHRAGLRVAALSIIVAGVGGYALQAGASGAAPAVPGEASVLTALQVDVDSGTDASMKIEAKLLSKPGQLSTLRFDNEVIRTKLPTPFQIAYTATRLDGDRLQIDATLSEGAALDKLASPRLITHDGEPARVDVRSSDGAHAVSVTFVPRVVTDPLGAMPPLAAPPAPPAPARLGKLPAAPSPARAPLAPVATPSLPAPPSTVDLPAPPAPPQRAS